MADLALTAERNGDEAMIAALQSMSLNEGEAGRKVSSPNAPPNRWRWPAAPPCRGSLAWTRALVGVPFEGDARAWLVAQVTDGAFDRRFIDAYLDYQILWGTATADKRIGPMRAWLAATPDVRADTLAEVQGAWMTGSARPPSNRPKR